MRQDAVAAATASAPLHIHSVHTELPGFFLSLLYLRLPSPTQAVSLARCTGRTLFFFPSFSAAAR